MLTPLYLFFHRYLHSEGKLPEGRSPSPPIPPHIPTLQSFTSLLCPGFHTPALQMKPTAELLSPCNFLPAQASLQSLFSPLGLSCLSGVMQCLACASWVNLSALSRYLILVTQFLVTSCLQAFFLFYDKSLRNNYQLSQKCLHVAS